jgi:septum formation protein
MRIILGSSSPFRRQLLQRLHVDFVVDSPDIDETAKPDESGEVLVRRLAEAKARAVAARQPDALVIGSDQVAVHEGTIMGKPHTVEHAIAQLSAVSGHEVRFYTGLCLLNSTTGMMQLEVIPFAVRFRTLTQEEISGYIAKEQPLNCAGSFQSEGLGVALLDSMHGDDPNALIGLPLIRLSAMLRAEGVNVLTD